MSNDTKPKSSLMALKLIPITVLVAYISITIACLLDNRPGADTHYTVIVTVFMNMLVIIVSLISIIITINRA